MLIKRFPIPPGTDCSGSNNARHIAYTEWGEPDNPHIVVCVHGLTRNCRDFDFLAHALAADCRVICVDVVGRGQSDWLANAADYDNYLLYLSDAVALLKHIGALGNANIQLDWVGVSMGGLIGMALAIQLPLPLPLPIPIRKLVMSDIGPLILKNAVGIYGKNSCNPILAYVFDKKFQLLRTCHESAGNKQWQCFQPARAVFL